MDQAEKNVTAAYKTKKDAWHRLQSAREQALKVARALQNRALAFEAAQARVDKAKREVYMAAALAAFQHVADEAIAKTQSELAAQHD